MPCCCKKLKNKSYMLCCCGCCRQAPGKLVHATGEDGRIVRVNLLYSAIGCCSNSGTGLLDEPPQDLFNNGFRKDTFDEWIGRLETIRQFRNPCCLDMFLPQYVALMLHSMRLFPRKEGNGKKECRLSGMAGPVQSSNS
jgi:hypothetical protein